MLIMEIQKKSIWRHRNNQNLYIVEDIIEHKTPEGDSNHVLYSPLNPKLCGVEDKRYSRTEEFFLWSFKLTDFI
ncbi:hypothetical protein QE357_002713 [Siphonobacter sp. BAB-5404]|nr:hypothetical protein [Siphonobacter sp. SORGH_AS_0500]